MNHQQVRAMTFARTCFLSRHTFKLMVFLCLLTGCASQSLPLPDLSEAREGDLVVSFSGTPQAWAFVQLSMLPRHRNRPPYSHTEILLKNDKGQWEIAGVANSVVRHHPLKSILPSFRQITIVRPTNNPDAQARFAEKTKQWLATPEIQKAEFVYTFEDIPGKTDAFYCVSFINELYRQCGLPIPMVAYQPPPTGVWRQLNKLSHLPQNRTINSPLTLFDLPEHKIITTWTNPHDKSDEIQLNHAMVQILFQWYDQGWELKQSNKINLLLKISDFPENLHAIAKLRVSLQSFAKDVQKCWQRLKRRGQLQENIPHATNPQIQNICLKYRGKYFRFVGKIPPAPAVAHHTRRMPDTTHIP